MSKKSTVKKHVKKKGLDANNASAMEALINDLEKLADDWELLMKQKELACNEQFLRQLADDIKHVDEDALDSTIPTQCESTAHLVHFVLSSPIGAPVAYNKTILEAALAFDLQDPLKSDLCQLTQSLLSHTHEGEENEYISMFHMFSEKLKGEY